MLRRLVRFFTISKTERILFIRTMASLFFTSLLIAIVPRGFFLKRIGILGVETPDEVSENDVCQTMQLIKTIRRCERVIPWRVTCFTKAISAKRMLKVYCGLPSTLYLGVGKVGDEIITAHAWLRCGNVIVTGKEEMARFTPVVFFS